MTRTWKEKMGDAIQDVAGEREDMRSSTEAEQNTRERCGWWWKLDGGKLRTNVNPGVEALSAGSIYSPASRCWSCHSQCALQPVSPAARWPLSLIRTLQHNTRRPRQWALCIIHKSQAHSAACVSLTHIQTQVTHAADSMMFGNGTHLNKQVHNQQDGPSELGTNEKGNSTAIN